MIVKGRGKFVAQLEGCVIRVDASPECRVHGADFWLEVQLTREELVKLLAALDGDEDE